MADITKSLRDVLTAYGKEEEREEALAEEKRRFDINKSLRERELARADQEFARKQKLWTREDQDQQAMDIASRVTLQEPQVKAGLITDTYVGSGAKLPELSGPGIMSQSERMKYLDNLTSGSIEKREPISLTPEEKRIEEEQSMFGQKVVDSKAFKETELDKLNRSAREILNAGYKIPNKLAKEINLAKATYLEKEKSDTDKITKRLNELNKEASGLRIKKGKAEDSFSKSRKSSSKDKGTYSQTFKALENMYEKIGRPDTFGVGDELKIENAILTYGDSLSASDNQTTRAIIKSRNDYNGILTNVKEEDFTNKFKENLAKIVKEEGPKGVKTSTSGSKESDEISARLKEIEQEKRTQANLVKTPDEKRQAILKGFLPDSSSENKETTEDKKSEKGSNSYKKTNNFTNIEKSNDNWVGKVKNGSSERFESFEKPEYGARAAIKDLRTKVKSGYDTIAKAITRHAPPSDNNPTDKYIENVSKWTGIDPNQKLTESDLSKVVQAMARQEHGNDVLNILNDKVLNKGYKLSLDSESSEVTSGEFPVVREPVVKKNNIKSEKETIRSLRNKINNYDNARQFASQEDIPLSAAEEIMSDYKTGRFTDALRLFNTSKETGLSRSDDFDFLGENSLISRITPSISESEFEEQNRLGRDVVSKINSGLELTPEQRRWYESMLKSPNTRRILYDFGLRDNRLNLR